MKLVLAALVCLVAAIAFSVETRVELEHRDVPALASVGADARHERAATHSSIAHSAANGADDFTNDASPTGERDDSNPDDEVASAQDGTGDDALFEDGAEVDGEGEGDDAAYGTVSGTLLDPSGAPIADGWVQLIPKDCASCSPEDAELDEQGAFTATVERGTWDVVGRAEGYQGDVVPGVVVGEDETEGIALTLRPGLKISGRVLADGQPVIGATVFLEGNGYRLSTTSEGDSAEFEFAGLPQGRYHLTAFEAGTGGDTRDVAAGETTTLALRTRTLSGVVEDMTGAPVVEAHVILKMSPLHGDGMDHDPLGPLDTGMGESDGCEDCDTVFTDEHGAFELEVPLASTIAIAATDDGDGRAFRNDLAASSGTVVLRLRQPRETRVRVVAAAPEASQPAERTAVVDENGDVPDSESAPEYEQPYALYMTDQNALVQALFADYSAGETTIDEDGTATLRTWDGMPVTVEEPYGAHVVAIDPLPPEVTISPAEKETGEEYASSPVLKEPLRRRIVVDEIW